MVVPVTVAAAAVIVALRASSDAAGAGVVSHAQVCGAPKAAPCFLRIFTTAA
jgi:hypothetical protein